MAGRANKLYGEAPHLGREDTTGKVVVKKDKSIEGKTEHLTENEGGGDMAPEHRHAHERREMHHRHMKEHMDMHHRHEVEHSHHKGHKGALHERHEMEKHEMHKRHHAEMKAMHDRHETEHGEGEAVRETKKAA
jgi:hypothetical protein